MSRAFQEGGTSPPEGSAEELIGATLAAHRALQRLQGLDDRHTDIGQLEQPEAGFPHTYVIQPALTAQSGLYVVKQSLVLGREEPLEQIGYREATREKPFEAISCGVVHKPTLRGLDLSLWFDTAKVWTDPQEDVPDVEGWGFQGAEPAIFPFDEHPDMAVLFWRMALRTDQLNEIEVIEKDAEGREISRWKGALEAGSDT